MRLLHVVLPLLLTSSAVLEAQSAKLFMDFNANPRPRNVNPQPARPYDSREKNRFLRFGNRFLISAHTESTGQELFLTDGTTAGTTLVKDIEPGAWSGNPRDLFRCRDGSRVFLTVDGEDPKKQEELWVTDGTAKGTIHLATFDKQYTPSITPICTLGPVSMLFRGYSSKQGWEPWISDGTPTGTRMLGDLVPGTGSSYPHYGHALGTTGTAVFACTQPATGTELWITDGTSQGTKLLKDIQVGTGSSGPRNFVGLAGSTVAFVADDGKAGYELWTTDGTPHRQQMVVDLNPGSALGAGRLYPFGSSGLAVFAGDDGKTGAEPYVTDGTPSGTRQLIDSSPGSWGGGVHSPTMDTQGKHMYWVSETLRNSWSILVSDGTPQGTQVFCSYPFGGEPLYLAELQGKIYFQGASIPPSVGDELCVTDGTVAGTKVVLDYWPGYTSRARWMTRLDASTLLFEAYKDYITVDLLRFSVGKPVVKVDIGVPGDQPTQPGATSNTDPYAYAVPFAHRMAFVGNDGKTGNELWITDGTPKGTQQVTDLAPGLADGANGPLAVLGDTIYFVGDAAGAGPELWATDGTSAGTYLVRDIGPGSLGAKITFMRSIGNLIYFTADDGVHGAEPWVTDGTKAGTRMLGDLAPGQEPSLAMDYAGYGTRVVFFAGGLHSAHGLYLTDGTPGGTTLLVPNLIGTTGAPDSRSMVAMGGKVYFSANLPAVGGQQLWVTDFTAAGTQVIASTGDSWGLMPGSLTACLGRIFFHGRTLTTGHELFASDGTKAGTRVYVDLDSPAWPTQPNLLTAIGSRHLYFISADYGDVGLEVHRTDGTKPGTVSFDISPGREGSAPGFAGADHHLVPVGDKVFVTARHPVYERELFVMTNGATVQPLGSAYRSTWIEGTDPVLGQKVLLRGGTRLGHAVHVLLHGVPTTRARSYGPAGWLHLDLFQYFGVTSVQTGPTFSLEIPIPSSPALQGIQLVHQSLSFDSTAFPRSVELSNGLLWTLGN